MGAEDIKSVWLRGMEAFNAADLSGWFEIHDPSVVAHGLAPEPLDFEGMKQFYETLFASFPDLQVNVEDVIQEGDKVAFRVTLHGTHQGDWPVPATGRSVAVPAQSIFHFQNGRVVERWSNADLMGLMIQLGAVPAPAG